MSNKNNSSNYNNSPIIRNQESSSVTNLNNINYDPELSINDDDKQKKQRSFNSFLTTTNKSSSSKASVGSIMSSISDVFRRKTHSNINSATLIPDIEEEDYDQDSSNEKFASHVAISLDGQYICTFNCKKLEFKIFETDTTINYLEENTVPITNEFVKIPKISESDNDNLFSYRMENGPLTEYMLSSKLKEAWNKHLSSENVSQGQDLNSPNLESNFGKLAGISLEKARTEGNRRDKLDPRKFPSWSIAMSNMMEYQGEHVIFIAISAVVEADMKKKMTREEEEEEERLYPNRSRYNRNEYEISTENQVPLIVSTETPPDTSTPEPEFDKGRTAIFKIAFDKNDHSLIKRPSRIEHHSSHDIAGIIMFVEKESKDLYENCLVETFENTSCILINAEGIFRINYYTYGNKLKEEKLFFPKRMEKELRSWYKSRHCMDRLLSCIYHHYFLVDQYKDGVHTIEMYDLSTMEQEQNFIIRHDESLASHTARDVSSVFAISKNKQLIACSNGERSVTLFWIENGLDVGVKEFGLDTQILFLEFINNDEKLLIVTEEEVHADSKTTNGGNQQKQTKDVENHDKLYNKQKQIEYVDNPSIIIEEGWRNSNDKQKQSEHIIFEEKGEKDTNNNNFSMPRITRRRSSCRYELSRVTKINVWDLFSSTEDAIRTGMSGNLFPEKGNYHSHIAKVPGKLYHMKEDGSVFSIMEHDGFVNLVNGEEKDSTLSFGCTIFLGFDSTQDQKDHMQCVYADYDDEEDLKLHRVFCRKRLEKSGKHKVLVNNKEPWVYINNYQRISIYLDEEETLQLIIGHSTVQIWRKMPKQKISDKKETNLQKKEPILEYIWANNIPTEYDIEDSKLQIKDLWVGDHAFSLKVYWQYYEGTTLMKGSERIWFPCTDGHVTPVLHACKALEHLNNRKNKIIDYKRMIEFEKLVESTNRIVWRFVKKKPEVFKLMDVRYDVMSSLVRGGCNYLIKFILFGEVMINNNNEQKKKKKKKEMLDHKLIKRTLHIPKAKQWISESSSPKMEETESQYFLFKFFSFIHGIILWVYAMITCNENRNKRRTKRSSRNFIPRTELEWAIECCKGKERKEAVLVGYLLEYYSENAIDHIGWMGTISKALPLLYKYNLDYYVKPLFFKNCFSDKEMTQYDPSEIIPEHSRPRRNRTQDFKAFKPVTKLVSDKNHKPILQVIFELITVKLPRHYTDFVDNFDLDRAPPPIALRVVPLPNFTVDNVPRDHIKYDWKSNLVRLLKIIVIPRGYIIGKEDKTLLSPFVQVVRYEKDNDIFDNPAMEAIIDFRWRSARNYFLQIFLAFVAYAVCFGVICWAYMSKLETSGNQTIFLVCVMGCFYYLAYYLIAVETMQAFHHGLRASINVGNLFDIISIVTPCIVMSIFVASSFQLSDGFGKVQNSTEIIVCISFTMLLLWCEMLLYLRLLSEMAKYIYCVIIIFSTVSPFLIFMLLVVMAFGHAFFLLLSNPDLNTIRSKVDTYLAINTTTGQPAGLELDSQFDPTSTDDNPFSSFLGAVETAYFWINGEWKQRDEYSYWAVEVLSVLGSIFLVTILQNMLIAFMGGVYEEAAEKGRDALLRYRATLISDYEALEDVRFWPREPDPEFIFYVGHSNSFEEWTEKKKDFKGCLFEKYESRASYRRFKFQEEPSDKSSLLKYDMDKKDSNSSTSSLSGDGKAISGSSLPLDESFKEFQQTINGKLSNMDQSIDNKIVDIQTNVQNIFTEIMKKLENIEKKKES